VEKQPTDERGEASFAIAPGPYVVLVRAEGLAPHYGKPFAVAAHESVRVDVVLGRGTVAEVLVKDEGGAPVAGAEVELRGPLESGARKRTDEQGRCRIAGIAAPDVDMDYWHKRMWWEVAAPGYAMAEGSRPITGRAGTERIDITLARGVPVRIRAIDVEGWSV
jgi:hypothetical protein